MVLNAFVALAPLFFGGIQPSNVSNYEYYSSFACSTYSPSTFCKRNNGEEYVINSYFEVHGRYYFDNDEIAYGSIWIDDITVSVVGSSSLTGFSRLDFNASANVEIGDYLNGFSITVTSQVVDLNELYYKFSYADKSYFSDAIYVSPYVVNNNAQTVSFGLSFNIDAFAASANEYFRGFTDGRNVGIAEGRQEDSQIVAIFGGILDIGLIPINVFLNIFNFDILGINLTAFVSAALTVFCVIIIIRSLVIGGNGK